MRIGEYELEWPFYNAGGLVKTVEDTKLMARTAVSAVMGGSFTLPSRAGNGAHGETVYHFDPYTGVAYNALSMPNGGGEYLEQHLSEMVDITHDHGKPYILNFSPVTSDPVAEIRALGDVLERSGTEKLDGIELNAGCPHIYTPDGKPHPILSHAPSLLEDSLGELTAIKTSRVQIGSVIVRISPFKHKNEAAPMAALLRRAGVDAVAAFNTFPPGVPLNEVGIPILQVVGNAGGRSGPGMRNAAEIQTEWLVEARQNEGGDYRIIGSNGISDAVSMQRRLEKDAAAVTATSLFWEAPSWSEAVDNLLNDYIELTTK